MSLQHHPHSLADVPVNVRSDEVAMRFRRRILHPRRLAKYEQGSAGFRAFRLGSMAFLAGSGVYLALFADFGTSDHCFTYIRKQFQTVRAKALALSEADALELEWRRSEERRH